MVCCCCHGLLHTFLVDDGMGVAQGLRGEHERGGVRGSWTPLCTPQFNNQEISLWCSWLSRSAVNAFIDTERSPARFRSRRLAFSLFAHALSPFFLILHSMRRTPFIPIRHEKTIRNGTHHTPPRLQILGRPPRPLSSRPRTA